MRFTWPLTGRSEEKRIVDAAISASDLSGIVICGALGVGKSRIAREALSTAASKGCAIRWAVGTSSARALPLGAFALWAGSAVTDTLQLVRGVIESLTSASPGTTVVVGVDDVHLLDELSTFVLHQIVQRRSAKVVLTIRDGEPIPSAVQEVWKAGQFDWLNLQPLSRDETTVLLSAALGGSTDPDAARRLWQLTRGNALYLRNIVEQEAADGRLVQQHGCWTWTGDPIIPRGLVEMIDSRIGNLPPSVGDVIDALTVDEPIELAALRRITDPAAVEDAENRGLITLDRVEGRVEVRVTHPLYAEVRRKRTALTRLQRLRGLVAAELAASERRDDLRIVVRRAALSLDSDIPPDPDLLRKAAKGAVWLADMRLADRLADAAIRAGAGPEANFVRAHALSWLNRGQEADTVLVSTPTSEFTDADHARVTFQRATNMMWPGADPKGAKELIDNALPHICIDAFHTLYWAALGKPEFARKSSKNLAVDQLPGSVGAWAAWAITVACGDAGRTDEAVAAADTGYTFVSQSFESPHMRFAVADVHVGALLLSGRVSEARDVGERLRQEAEDLPGDAQVFSTAVEGLAALGAGRLDKACSLLGTAVELLYAAGDIIGYRYQLPRLIALAMCGSTDQAADALATLEEHSSIWGYVAYQRALAQAWIAAGQGAVTEAIATLLAAAETARANEQFAIEVVCLQAATQLGDPSTALRLRELVSAVEGPRVGIAARFAAGLSADDGSELAAVSEEFERIGDLVAAVDAAAHAAMAYRRQGLRGSGYGCTTRAQVLADQCGGANTPALRRAAEPLPLTDREREIVMLIGAGFSNREVAERLNISVRTVEGHIYKAMTKTGAGSREEVTALLARGRST